MPRRRLPRVTEYLEDINRSAFEAYPAVMDRLSRKRHGVYALYKRGRLYYVGLAKDLRNRLRAHLKDRHAKAWDTFRLYLTIDNKHMKELESLLIRIANPDGNKQSGRFARAIDLTRKFDGLVAEEQKATRDSLYGPRTRTEARDARKERKASRQKLKRPRGSNRFAGAVERTTTIRWTYKGTTHKARLGKDGGVRYDGHRHETPTDAAKSICGRRYNGWHVWQYQRSPGLWVPLKELRR